jgi:hypothetical protein
MHLLHFLRWVTLFVLPPPSPLSDEGEQPYSPSSPTPPSPTPPLPPRDQHECPIAIVQPLPPYCHQPYNNHENIVWAGAANHPVSRSCHQAGRVGYYSCSLGRPCLRPQSSAQFPAIDPPLPHSATNGILSLHGQHDITPEEEESWEDFGWTAGATDAQQQRSAADLEWDANVDEAAYAGAAAYREGRYGQNGYTHGGMRGLPLVTLDRRIVGISVGISMSVSTMYVGG